ncbi:hypothetical protein [Kamptonema formosum]|uniref:hypothetical protein n=1 Tax=Kamptonema formosum TaxID=331992 RepID=UPI0003489669|nr:hypothetical protein [Oscillatoria sp. PCC 10802]
MYLGSAGKLSCLRLAIRAGRIRLAPEGEKARWRCPERCAVWKLGAGDAANLGDGKFCGIGSAGRRCGGDAQY